MLAAIIPWQQQQQALWCFVRASRYQGSVLIRNGGKDAEQVGLAAVRAVPSPLAWAVKALWGGFGDQSEIPALFNRQHFLCFFSPPLFCKGCASWEHFPCSALVDARGLRDVPAQLPFLRAQGWRRPLAQTKPPAIKTSWALHWVGTTTGEYQLYQEPAQSSKNHRRDLCSSWIPCSRNPAVSCAWSSCVL